MSLRLLSRMNGKDTCRMRLGVGAAGLERVYLQKDFDFPKGQAVPKAGKIYLAGNTGYGGASGSCAPARGSYQMVSYWERVLTDDEIFTAFRIVSLAEGAEDSASVLRIGGVGRTPCGRECLFIQHGSGVRPGRASERHVASA